MTDAELAKEANSMLAVVIAGLITDVEPLAVSVNIEGGEDRDGTLRQVGEDVTVLAMAMQVLTRWAAKKGDSDGV